MRFLPRFSATRARIPPPSLRVCHLARLKEGDAEHPAPTSFFRVALTGDKATVQKIINEILANDPGVTFAKETRDLLIECCVEFITMISSEANDIAEKEAKKTIACEHVKAALEDFGFGNYVDDIMQVAADQRKQQMVGAQALPPSMQGALTPDF